MTKPTDHDLDEPIQEARSEGFFGLAVELARRHMHANPEDIDAQFLLGVCLLEADQYPESRRTLESVLPKCSDAARPWVLLNLALVCKLSGDLEKGHEYASKAIAEGPEDAEHYAELAQILQAEGKRADAEACLRKGLAAEARPESDLLLPLARLLCTRHALEEAAACARQVVEEHPDNEDAAVLLQDIEELAKLTGVDLGTQEDEGDDKQEEDEDEPEEPRQITANIEWQFFAEIVAGTKKIEYRDATEHWHKKIEKAGSPPFHLRLINGMRQRAPELTVVVNRVLLDVGELVFELHLGEIIDLQNWDEKRRPSR